jgi:hypothetical protein
MASHQGLGSIHGPTTMESKVHRAENSEDKGKGGRTAA